MNQEDVQVLEAAEEVAVKPGLNAKHKVFAIVALAVITTGALVFAGIKVSKHIKAKKSTKQLANAAEEKAEGNE